jgi:hypothetical protein
VWVRPAGQIRADNGSLYNYDHYHLNYENSDAEACYPNGFTAEGCDQIDPAKEPRSVSPHDGGEWLSVTVYNLNGFFAFNLERLTVDREPIRLCYTLAAQGPWLTSGGPDDTSMQGSSYCWDTLDPGFVWDVSDWVNEVTQVRMRSASGSTPIIDDLLVSMNIP